MAEESKGGGNGERQAAAGEPQFGLQKIYLKDASLETPSSPEVFQTEWKPEANVELNSKHRSLGNDTFEVIVTVTVTAKLQDKTAYLCEVQQAGVFTLAGFAAETREGLLGSYCPGMLFPYAREAVSALTGRGGFPPMVLAPVNFDALYAQQRARQAQAGQAKQTQ